MPELVRLYIRQCLVGFALAVVFTGALLWLNVANLGHLVTSSDVGIIAAGMLTLFNGLVFAGVQFAIAIMRMEEREDDEPRGGLPVMLAEPVPVAVPAGADARRMR